MKRLRIDIETYSATPVTNGVYRYVEDPDFRILFANWAYEKGETQTAFGPDILLIPGLFDPGVIKVAHNSAFERICFSRWAWLAEHKDNTWPVYLAPEEWHDSMASAASQGLPQSLKYLARALGAEDKDEAGTRLIRKFCVPGRGGRVPTWSGPDWERFIDYGVQDVETLIDIDDRIGDIKSAAEWDTWVTDQKINDRGIRVDTTLARNAVDIALDNEKEMKGRIIELTGVDNPGSVAQLKKWILDSEGIQLESLNKSTVSELLERDDISPSLREVLTLRQSLALVAFKKFQAALDAVCLDGRARGQFRYFGAHTGRWTGRGIQLQNLARGGFYRMAEVEGKMVKVYDERAQDQALEMVRLGVGSDAETLKKLVRPMLVGPFSVCDFSAIEARVIAWLAGEDWTLEAFSRGRDIYVETAGRMGGLTRAQGKVAVLALGYGGGIASLKAMAGGQLDNPDGTPMTDDQMHVLVNQWRRANPHIVRWWKMLEQAFFRGGAAGRRIRIEGSGNERQIVLPSGRAIVYHQLEWGRDQYGNVRPSFWMPTGGAGGYRCETYGGRLAENVTQAVARDLLAASMVRMEAQGLPVVGHVHDEVLVETTDLEAVHSCMIESPVWAPGIPLDASGYVTQRYHKD